MQRFLGFAVVLAISASALGAGITAVVPNAYENTPGTSTFIGPHAIGERTYQMLIHESQLTDFVGLPLNGISWRLPTSATSVWPGADINYTFYHIFLSASVAPADRSLVFANNVVGTQTLVRSGPLSMSAGAHPFGSSPNDFAPTISFNEWLYTGGHLLVEIRHSGNSFGSRSLDALSTSTAGYGSLFSAAWTGSATGTSGSQGNFTVAQFSAVPEPTTAILFGVATLLALRRRG